MDLAAVEAVAAVEESELDEEREAHDLAAEPLDEAEGRRGRAAGREDVVDDEHLLAGRDRVAVDLEQVGAVLELVLLALDLPRELARLADGARIRPRAGRRPAPRTRTRGPRFR